MPTNPAKTSSVASASALLKRSSQVVQGETLDLLVDMGLPVATLALAAALVDSYGRKVLDLPAAPETLAPGCTTVKLTGATLALRPGKYSYEVRGGAGASVLYSPAYELHVLAPLAASGSTAPPPSGAGNSLTVGPFAAGASAISALRCVMLTAGAFEICDGSDPASFSRMVGLATASALPGDLMSAVRSGLVSDASWNWSLAAPVYVGAGGLLTQDLTGLAYIQIAGYPESPTAVYMDVEEAVRL